MGVSDGDGSGGGIITATLQETFEPLHTGHSLIFTIAPNGHVWGKRLDEKSGKNDIEIEIFAPYLRGMLFRKLGMSPSIHKPTLTKEQERKINLILGQKERINYLLGTLMLRSHEVSLVGNYHHWDCRRKNSFERPSINPEELPYRVKVVDCSYGNSTLLSSNLGHWALSYDDASFRFHFYANVELRQEKAGALQQVGNCFDKGVQNLHHYPKFDHAFPRFRYHSLQAENKKFDLIGCESKSPTLAKILPRTLKIMYGEYDFFDYFEVDDAVLLLEEERLSETESNFYWTIGVAKNKLARNLMRLKSNNPELLAT